MPPIESALTPLVRLALDRNGNRLTLVGRASHFRVHDVASGLPVSPQMHHHYDIATLTASPDGSRILTYGTDAIANLWDATTGQQVVNLVRLNAIRTAAQFSLSRDGSRVLVSRPAPGGAGHTLQLWTPGANRAAKLFPARVISMEPASARMAVWGRSDYSRRTGVMFTNWQRDVSCSTSQPPAMFMCIYFRPMPARNGVRLPS